MPLFTINTNVSGDKVPSDLKKDLTDIIAEQLGKPAAYIAIHVRPNQDISFGHKTDPAAMCELVSIGSLSVDVNKKVSAALCKLIEDKLKVSPSRVYIEFKNVDKADVGFNNTTWHDLI